MSRPEALPRGDPESQGVSSRAIRDFARAADERLDSLHGFMLLRHGAVVAEGAWKPYSLDYPHMLYSLSKSFTSTAIGLLVDEGRLSVEAPVASLFPGKAPKTVSPNLSAMKVRHLLSMNTGHDEDTTERIMRSRDPVRAFLELPVEREPGSHFVYNSGASFVLSALVQELSGERLSSYLGPRLFDRIGIRGAKWDRHPCGIDFGGWGLNIRLEDVARFGQLYLQKGLWKGERVLPERWIEEATSKVSDNSDPKAPNPESDWQQGYGYQFWRCRRGFYRGDGAFGQYCVVMPGLDAVFASFSGLSDMQAALDLVWDLLVPGIAAEAPGRSGAALPADPEALGELKTTVGALELRKPSPGPGASGAASGSREYRFGPNWAGLESMSFDFREDGLELGYRITRKMATGNGLDGPLRYPRGSGRRSLKVGYGEWAEGVSWLDGEGPKPASCAGAWTAPEVFTMRLFAHSSPIVQTLAFRFAGESVKVEVSLNVNMGPTSFPAIEGMAR